MSIRNTNLMENMENLEMVKINELDTDLTKYFFVKKNFLLNIFLY